MIKSNVRVRFAPSPTGKMHLGNARAGLFNYLFARQKNGTFVLRIEDTDLTRNVELGGKKIVEDLRWLGLKYDEGPIIGGPHAPYIQSERTKIYQERLEQLILNQKVYRCFCSAEELEKKRKDNLSKGLPPRYDRTCLKLSGDMIKEKLNSGVPFIWRLKINQDSVVEVQSLARGKMKFELKDFSDFGLTRSDGSFTFMFANLIDDWLMGITHVIRGEDHLTNTAMQAALFDAFATQLPVFWHLPMLCNEEGKILSKRDFGSSIDDLKEGGFLPEAICNYLASLGCSLNSEIQSLDELSDNFNFDSIHSGGAIHYDLEKLRWFNHKWIDRLDCDELLKHAKPFLKGKFPESESQGDEKLAYLLDKVKAEAFVFGDFVTSLGFYFNTPKVSKKELESNVGQEKAGIILGLISKTMPLLDKKDVFLSELKSKGKEAGLKPKELLGTLRYLLTGSFQGISIHDLLEMLDVEEVRRRLEVLQH